MGKYFNLYQLPVRPDDPLFFNCFSDSPDQVKIQFTGSYHNISIFGIVADSFAVGYIGLGRHMHFYPSISGVLDSSLVGSNNRADPGFFCIFNDRPHDLEFLIKYHGIKGDV